MTTSNPKRASSKISACILAYRDGAEGLEVLLVHPGGPFWRNKDEGAWSIPKGEIDVDEDPEGAARREFAEELGPDASIGALRPLGEIGQRGRKRVIAFSGKSDFHPTNLVSNSFEIEWPPRSGRRQPFPEVDRAEWFPLAAARMKILSAQAPFWSASWPTSSASKSAGMIEPGAGHSTSTSKPASVLHQSGGSSERGAAGRSTRMTLPVETSPLSITTPMTPALKGGPSSSFTSMPFKPDRKRSIRPQGVLKPVRRMRADAPIRSSVFKARLSRSRPAVVMFSPSSPGRTSYPAGRRTFRSA
jgi:predicted NUDIX family NTP pyrophosphohydrolase